MSAELNALLKEWNTIKAVLADAKVRELVLREQIVRLAFAEHDESAEGTKRVALGKGWQLAADFKQNRKVTGTVYDVAGAKLKLVNDLGLSKEQVDAIFRTKYELGVGAYRDLDGAALQLVNSLIETSPGLVSLELVEPKK